MNQELTNTAQQALEACPFCGGDAEYVSVGDRGYVRISCKNAVSCGHHGSAMPRAADAAQAWNTRAGTEMETSSGPSLHWRCFHCNYIARSHAEALAHFGPGISERPASCLTQRPAAQEVDGVPEHLIPRIIKGVIESAAQAKGVDHDH